MQKKLYRTRQDKIIGGVCGGLGKYFDIDPVLIRVLFVLLAFFEGIGLLIYLLLLIIVPREPIILEQEFEAVTTPTDDETTNYPSLDQPSRTKKFFGIVLLVIGTLLLLQNFVSIFKSEIIIPLIIILIGIYLLYESLKKDGEKHEN